MKIDKIKVNVSKMNSDKEKLNEQLNNIKSQIEQVFFDFQQLNTMWEGLAKTAMENAITEDYNMSIELLNEMNKHIEKIKFANDKYIECEEKIESIVDSIKIN